MYLLDVNQKLFGTIFGEYTIAPEDYKSLNSAMISNLFEIFTYGLCEL